MKRSGMFKLHFVNLCNVNNMITLALLQSNKPVEKRLNKLTVRIYHILFGTGK